MPTNEVRIDGLDTSKSSFVVNIGYLKSFSGILKVLQLFFGSICVAIISFYLNRNDMANEYFFMLMTVSFLVSTSCLLLACATSFTGELLARTTYEWIFNLVAFILYLLASIVLFGEALKNHKSEWKKNSYFTASALGLLVSFLYLTSFIVSLFVYRHKK